jgi:hypothetical protein
VVISDAIRSDAINEFCNCRHMQLARAVATLDPLHQAIGKKNMAMLTALAAQSVRLEYAGSSVMKAVCCATISSDGLSRTRNRTAHAILKCNS